MNRVNRELTGDEIKTWRESRGLTQAALGEMVGDVTGPTIGRWENGSQEIPGPAQLLLKMLVWGEMPFTGVGPAADPEAEDRNFWKLRLTLEQWHQLEGLAMNAGYGDTKDYILSLLNEHLQEQVGPGAEVRDDLPLAAEDPPTYGGQLVKDPPPQSLAGDDGSRSDSTKPAEVPMSEAKRVTYARPKPGRRKTSEPDADGA